MDSISDLGPGRLKPMRDCVCKPSASVLECWSFKRVRLYPLATVTQTWVIVCTLGISQVERGNSWVAVVLTRPVIFPWLGLIMLCKFTLTSQWCFYQFVKKLWYEATKLIADTICVQLTHPVSQRGNCSASAAFGGEAQLCIRQGKFSVCSQTGC